MSFQGQSLYDLAQHFDTALVTATAVTGKFEIVATLDKRITVPIATQPDFLQDHSIIKKGNVITLTGNTSGMACQLFAAHTVQPVPDDSKEHQYKHQIGKLHTGLAATFRHRKYITDIILINRVYSYNPMHANTPWNTAQKTHFLQKRLTFQLFVRYTR